MPLLELFEQVHGLKRKRTGGNWAWVLESARGPGNCCGRRKWDDSERSLKNLLGVEGPGMEGAVNERSACC